MLRPRARTLPSRTWTARRKIPRRRALHPPIRASCPDQARARSKAITRAARIKPPRAPRRRSRAKPRLSRLRPRRAIPARNSRSPQAIPSPSRLSRTRAARSRTAGATPRARKSPSRPRPMTAMSSRAGTWSRRSRGTRRNAATRTGAARTRNIPLRSTQTLRSARCLRSSSRMNRRPPRQRTANPARIRTTNPAIRGTAQQAGSRKPPQARPSPLTLTQTATAKRRRLSAWRAGKASPRPRPPRRRDLSSRAGTARRSARPCGTSTPTRSAPISRFTRAGRKRPPLPCAACPPRPRCATAPRAVPVI